MNFVPVCESSQILKFLDVFPFVFLSVFAGLGLVYIVQSVAMTQSAFKKSVVVETLMTSVERVMTYTELEPEPGYKVEQNPPKNWPNEGNIAFKEVLSGWCSKFKEYYT